MAHSLFIQVSAQMSETSLTMLFKRVALPQPTHFVLTQLHFLHSSTELILAYAFAYSTRVCCGHF